METKTSSQKLVLGALNSQRLLAWNLDVFQNIVDTLYAFVVRLYNEKQLVTVKDELVAVVKSLAENWTSHAAKGANVELISRVRDKILTVAL